jgi:hypothetical protein
MEKKGGRAAAGVGSGKGMAGGEELIRRYQVGSRGQADHRSVRVLGEFMGGLRCAPGERDGTAKKFLR